MGNLRVKWLNTGTFRRYILVLLTIGSASPGVQGNTFLSRERELPIERVEEYCQYMGLNCSSPVYDTLESFHHDKTCLNLKIQAHHRKLAGLELNVECYSWPDTYTYLL